MSLLVTCALLVTTWSPFYSSGYMARSKAELSQTVPSLSGVWQADVDNSQVTLTLTQDGIKLTGKLEVSKDQFRSVAGSVSQNGDVELVELVPRSATNLPDEAWAQVLAKFKDPQNPQFLRGGIRLHYDADKKLMIGKRKGFDVGYDRASPSILTRADPFEYDITFKRDALVGFARIDHDEPLAQTSPLELFRITAIAPPALMTEQTKTINGRVTNTRTGQQLNIELNKMTEEGRSFASDPIFIADEGMAPPILIKNIAAEPGDRLEAEVGGFKAQLEIVAFPTEPALEAAAGLALKLVADDDSPITFDLDSGLRGKPLRARLSDDRNEPLEGFKIAWVIPSLAKSPVSETDATGTAQLDFAVTRTGQYVVVVDGVPVGAIPEDSCGTGCSIKAVPLDADVASLLEGDAPIFNVKLIAPTMVNLIDAAGAPISVHTGNTIRVAVRPGRKWHTGQGEVNIELKSSDGDMAIIKAQAAEDRPIMAFGQRHFEYVSEPFEIGTKFIGQTFNVGKGSTITARWLEGPGSVTVQHYANGAILADTVTPEIISSLSRAITVALMDEDLTPEEREVLQLKALMAANAEVWMRQPAPFAGARAPIAAAYISLLLLPRSELIQPFEFRAAVNKAILPPFLKNVNLTFVSPRERADVEAAITAVTLEGTRLVLDGYLAIVNEVVSFALAPQAGLYTSLTGETIDGRTAAILERVLGGVTVVAALAPIAVLGKQLVAIGRSARALEARVFTMEARVAEQAFANSLEKNLLAVSRTEAEAAAARVSEKTAKLAAAKELQRVEKIAATENLLTELRAQLKQIQANTATRPKTSRKLIGPKKRNIAKVENRLERLATELPGNLSKDDLKSLIQQKRLPDPEARINGKVVHNLYESVVDKVLIERSPNWKNQVSVKLPEPTRIPAFRDTGRPQPKILELGPREDHINVDPVSFAAAEEKYFNAWPENFEWPKGASVADLTAEQRRVISRLEQVVDSVEKARLTQWRLLATRPFAEAAPANAAIWRQVWEKNVYVLTPVRVPDYFVNLVRARLRMAGKNVFFEVIPFDLAAFAK